MCRNARSCISGAEAETSFLTQQLNQKPVALACFMISITGILATAIKML